MLGIRISSSDATISGDYMKTAQTNSGYAVFHCAAKGMYLFVGYAEGIYEPGGNYWALNSTVVSQLGDVDGDANVFQQTVYAKHPTSDESMTDWDTMEVSDDFRNPNASFLTTTWTTTSGTVSITASDIVQDPLPLLDEFHLDWSGRANRLSTAMEIPREGLVFDAQFTHEISHALTGQALTITGSEPEGDSFGTVWLQNYHGDRMPTGAAINCLGGSSLKVTFPDDALPSGRSPLSLSAWVMPWGRVFGSLLKVGNIDFKLDGETYYDSQAYVNVNNSNPGGNMYSLRFYHVVVLFSGQSVVLYQDGTRKGQANCDVDISKSGTAELVGGDGNAAIAGIRVYNRILSESEIQCLFNEHSDIANE